MAEQETKENIQNLPKHVAIIMDGNGRWAVARGLSRKAGHKEGAKAFEKIVEYASSMCIKYLTVYAFSTENFKRPADEVKSIMDLMRSYLKDQRRRKNSNVRFNFIGDIKRLDQDIQDSVARMMDETKNNTQMILNIAFNYGGRLDVLQAAKLLAEDYKSGIITDINAVNEDEFAEYLYTRNQPDVDLLIRTSGELRISNFLIWQAAYAEIIVTNVLWPDFTKNDFDFALEEYYKRNRRLGGV